MKALAKRTQCILPLIKDSFKRELPFATLPSTIAPNAAAKRHRQTLRREASVLECQFQRSSALATDKKQIITASFLAKNTKNTPAKRKSSDASNKHVHSSAFTHPRTNNLSDQSSSTNCITPPVAEGNSHPVQKPHIRSKESKTVNTNFDESGPIKDIAINVDEAVRIAKYVLDKFSVTIPAPQECQPGVIDAAEDFNRASPANLQLTRLARTGRAYGHSYELFSEEGQKLALIEFEPARRTSNYLRVEFNPAMTKKSGCRLVLRALRYLLGENYQSYLEKGNVTRMDLTIDIEMKAPYGFLVFSPNPRQTTTWGRISEHDGKWTFITETQTVGSPRSDFRAKAYDKTAQIWKVKGKKLDQQLTRVEISLRPRRSGRSSLLVSELLDARNPFDAIRVSHHPMTEEDPHFEFFVCACQMWGTDAAIKRITNKHTRAVYRQRLSNHQPDWWQPDAVWSVFLKRLASIGLVLTGRKLERLDAL